MDGAKHVANNYPASASAYWWLKNKMNAMIDAGATVREVTRKVNGGYNGLADRTKYYNRAVKIWSGSFTCGTRQAVGFAPMMMMDPFSGRFEEGPQSNTSLISITVNISESDVQLDLCVDLTRTAFVSSAGHRFSCEELELGGACTLVPVGGVVRQQCPVSCKQCNVAVGQSTVAGGSKDNSNSGTVVALIVVIVIIGLVGVAAAIWRVRTDSAEGQQPMSLNVGAPLLLRVPSALFGLARMQVLHA